MTKSELIEKVSGKVKNFTKRDVEIIVDTIFENMTGSAALQKEKRLRLEVLAVLRSRSIRPERAEIQRQERV